MSRIEKLTDAQIARMAEFRDRWIKIGLSTEPADRPVAEAGIIESYRAAGLSPPQRIVWCGSPLSQGLTRAIILDKRMIADIGKRVWAGVRDSVWDSVFTSMVRDDAENPFLPLSELATQGAYLFGVTDDGTAYVWRGEES